MRACCSSKTIASLGQTLAERLSDRRPRRAVGGDVRVGPGARRAPSAWDLAIVDVMLPDGSGFDLAPGASSGIATIADHVHDGAELRREPADGFELGADEYLPKPFHLKEFLLRVRHVLTDAAAAPGRCRSATSAIDWDAMAIERPPAASATFLQVRDGRVLAACSSTPRRARRRRSEILDRVWGEHDFRRSARSTTRSSGCGRRWATTTAS